MSFKSQAHKDKMGELLKEGKITQETYDKFEKLSKGTRLPARAPKKTKSDLVSPVAMSTARRRK